MNDVSALHSRLSAFCVAGSCAYLSKPVTPARRAALRELLYNGIRLPEEWPPRSIVAQSLEPLPVPYLDHPPEVIPIDLGRQLFVDDFLIGETDLKRSFHKAKKYEGNPVLSPETEMELNRSRNAVACPKSGGVWWDPGQKVGVQHPVVNACAGNLPQPPLLGARRFFERPEMGRAICRRCSRAGNCL